MKVRKIVLSNARFAQLRAQAIPGEVNPLYAIELEVSAVCDERCAVLVDWRGRVIGIYSFEAAEARWFPKPLGVEPRFTPPEPTFCFGERFTTVHRHKFGLVGIGG